MRCKCHRRRAVPLPGRLAAQIPGNIAWFGTYELICDMFRKNKGDETEELSPSCYILVRPSVIHPAARDAAGQLYL